MTECWCALHPFFILESEVNFQLFLHILYIELVSFSFVCIYIVFVIFSITVARVVVVFLILNAST